MPHRLAMPCQHTTPAQWGITEPEGCLLGPQELPLGEGSTGMHPLGGAIAQSSDSGAGSLGGACNADMAFNVEALEGGLDGLVLGPCHDGGAWGPCLLARPEEELQPPHGSILNPLLPHGSLPNPGVFYATLPGSAPPPVDGQIVLKGEDYSAREWDMYASELQGEGDTVDPAGALNACSLLSGWQAAVDLDQDVDGALLSFFADFMHMDKEGPCDPPPRQQDEEIGDRVLPEFPGFRIFNQEKSCRFNLQHSEIGHPKDPLHAESDRDEASAARAEAVLFQKHPPPAVERPAPSPAPDRGSGAPEDSLARTDAPLSGAEASLSPTTPPTQPASRLRSSGSCDTLAESPCRQPLQSPATAMRDAGQPLISLEAGGSSSCISSSATGAKLFGSHAKPENDLRSPQKLRSRRLTETFDRVGESLPPSPPVFKRASFVASPGEGRGSYPGTLLASQGLDPTLFREFAAVKAPKAPCFPSLLPRPSLSQPLYLHLSPKRSWQHLPQGPETEGSLGGKEGLASSRPAAPHSPLGFGAKEGLGSSTSAALGPQSPVILRERMASQRRLRDVSAPLLEQEIGDASRPEFLYSRAPSCLQGLKGSIFPPGHPSPGVEHAQWLPAPQGAPHRPRSGQASSRSAGAGGNGCSGLQAGGGTAAGELLQEEVRRSLSCSSLGGGNRACQAGRLALTSPAPGGVSGTVPEMPSSLFSTLHGAPADRADLLSHRADPAAGGRGGGSGIRGQDSQGQRVPWRNFVQLQGLLRATAGAGGLRGISGAEGLRNPQPVIGTRRPAPESPGFSPRRTGSLGGIGCSLEGSPWKKACLDGSVLSRLRVPHLKELSLSAAAEEVALLHSANASQSEARPRDPHEVCFGSSVTALAPQPGLDCMMPPTAVGLSGEKLWAARECAGPAHNLGAGLRGPRVQTTGWSDNSRPGIPLEHRSTGRETEGNAWTLAPEVWQRGGGVISGRGILAGNRVRSVVEEMSVAVDREVADVSSVNWSRFKSRERDSAPRFSQQSLGEGPAAALGSVGLPGPKAAKEPGMLPTQRDAALTSKSMTDKRRRERISQASARLRSTIKVHGDMASLILQAAEIIENQKVTIENLQNQVLIGERMNLQ